MRYLPVPLLAMLCVALLFAAIIIGSVAYSDVQAQTTPGTGVFGKLQSYFSANTGIVDSYQVQDADPPESFAKTFSSINSRLLPRTAADAECAVYTVPTGETDGTWGAGECGTGVPEAIYLKSGETDQAFTWAEARALTANIVNVGGATDQLDERLYRLPFNATAHDEWHNPNFPTWVDGDNASLKANIDRVPGDLATADVLDNTAFRLAVGRYNIRLRGLVNRQDETRLRVSLKRVATGTDDNLWQGLLANGILEFEYKGLEVTDATDTYYLTFDGWSITGMGALYLLDITQNSGGV